MCLCFTRLPALRAVRGAARAGRCAAGPRGSSCHARTRAAERWQDTPTADRRLSPQPSDASMAIDDEIDLTEGRGGVYKKVLRPASEGEKAPPSGSNVTVHYGVHRPPSCLLTHGLH